MRDGSPSGRLGTRAVAPAPNPFVVPAGSLMSSVDNAGRRSRVRRRRLQRVAWIGYREMCTPAAVLASLEGAFRFLEGSDDGTVPARRIPQLGAIGALIGYWTRGRPSRRP